MAKTLPVMMLKDFILLPNQEVKLELNNPLSHSIIELSEKEYNNKLVIVSPKDSLEEVPKVSDLPEIAVIGIIKKRIVLGDNLERITILGEKRIKVNRYYNLPLKEEILQCDYLSPQIATISDSESTAMKRELIKLLKQIPFDFFLILFEQKHLFFDQVLVLVILQQSHLVKH